MAATTPRPRSGERRRRVRRGAERRGSSDGGRAGGGRGATRAGVWARAWRREGLSTDVTWPNHSTCAVTIPRVRTSVPSWWCARDYEFPREAASSPNTWHKCGGQNSNTHTTPEQARLRNHRRKGTGGCGAVFLLQDGRHDVRFSFAQSPALLQLHLPADGRGRRRCRTSAAGPVPVHARRGCQCWVASVQCKDDESLVRSQ